VQPRYILAPLAGPLKHTIFRKAVQNCSGLVSAEKSSPVKDFRNAGCQTEAPSIEENNTMTGPLGRWPSKCETICQGQTFFFYCYYYYYYYYICPFLYRRLVRTKYFEGGLQSLSVHKLNYMKQESNKNISNTN